MKTCLICGEATTRPMQSVFSHFWLWQPGQLQFLRGNISVFGFWSGLDTTICLICPAYNTLRHWKHRKTRLSIGDEKC